MVKNAVLNTLCNLIFKMHMKRHFLKPRDKRKGWKCVRAPN